MTATDPVKSSSTTCPWLVYPKPNLQAQLRLFCFPYAGAGPVIFHTWPAGLPPQIEVIALHYPGREARLREAPFSSIQPMVKAIASEILPFLDRPFAFYGHSLGGLIAFELARSLRRQQAPQPEHLILSSRRAAHLPDPYPHIHILGDTAFAQAIQQRYNGIPKVIQQDPELMALFLPILKADFSVLETYQYTPESAFYFPISVYGGLQDPGATREELSAWQYHTTKTLSLEMFPGDHFFLQSQRSLLLAAISNNLLSYIKE